MTRILLLSSLIGLAAAQSFAHPGIGIVVNSKGIVFYTDLKHVWKLLPDGTKHIAVRNVHTRELYVDSEDNLYGEHLWYEGKTTDRWGHRVWRLSPDGTLEDVIPARTGFKDDYDDFHFVRDARGAMYWVDREENLVRMKSPGEPIKTIAASRFRNVRWMTVSPEGTAYLIDLFDLVRVRPDGSLNVLARNLAERQREFVIFRNEHAVMGLSADTSENVFVAVASDRVVRKVTPGGQVTIVHRSSGAWVPTGVCAATNGDLLVLEYKGNTAARAYRIPASKLK